MSVCFGEEWDVLIRGSKEDLEDVVTIADLVAEKEKQAEFGLTNKSIIKLAKQFHKSFQAADFQDINGKGVMSIKYSGYDGEHDAMEEFLFNFSHNLPQLEIAFKGVYIDLEFTNKSYVSYYYYAPGKTITSISAHDFLNENKAAFPKENWIPEEWTFGEALAPYAKAEGSLNFCGSWPEELKIQIQDALNSNIFLKTLKYIKLLPNETTPFAINDKYISIKAGGYFDFGEACCHIDTFLKPFLVKNIKKYKSLCMSMFEKGLTLHLELNAFDGASSQSWSYPNNSVWNYLITSDGNKLISRPVCCRTYSFGPVQGISAKECVTALYKAVTSKNPKTLSDEELLNLSIHYILDIVKNTSLPNFWISNSNKKNGFDDDLNERYLDKNALNKYIKKKEAAIIELFSQTQINNSEFTYALPTKYDNRFAGQGFALKGKLKHYSDMQIKDIVSKYGGKLQQNITKNTNYCIFGEGIGSQFKKMLDKETTFVSEEYFSKMIK